MITLSLEIDKIPNVGHFRWIQSNISSIQNDIGVGFSNHQRKGLSSIEFVGDFNPSDIYQKICSQGYSIVSSKINVSQKNILKHGKKYEENLLEFIGKIKEKKDKRKNDNSSAAYKTN